MSMNQLETKRKIEDALTGVIGNVIMETTLKSASVVEHSIKNDEFFTQDMDPCSVKIVKSFKDACRAEYIRTMAGFAVTMQQRINGMMAAFTEDMSSTSSVGTIGSQSGDFEREVSPRDEPTPVVVQEEPSSDDVKGKQKVQKMPLMDFHKVATTESVAPKKEKQVVTSNGEFKTAVSKKILPVSSGPKAFNAGLPCGINLDKKNTTNLPKGGHMWMKPLNRSTLSGLIDIARSATAYEVNGKQLAMTDDDNYKKFLTEEGYFNGPRQNEYEEFCFVVKHFFDYSQVLDIFNSKSRLLESGLVGAGEETVWITRY